MRRRLIAVLALASALAAATPIISTPPPRRRRRRRPLPRRPPIDACGAGQLHYLIGRPVSEVPTYARHEQRVMGQGSYYDDGYRAERLTIIYDEATGRITRVRCG